ncbi:MAG: septum formation protein Maf [Alphaproteobacteria bacterium]|nr:septum formation protein Maf [Alphaproteobacteria bacterium]
MRPIVLASTSPYRARILAEAGIPYVVVPPGVDETAFADPDPAKRAVAIAVAKARAVASDGIVLAADQVVYDPDSGEVFGKPRDTDDHVRRLLGLRGRTHDLVTGWAVVCDGALRSGVERTRITVRDVSEAEIRAYVATGEASGCAGGYAAEARGGFLIERVEGDWLNVIGLPLFRVWDALRDLGWRFDG